MASVAAPAPQQGSKRRLKVITGIVVAVLVVTVGSVIAWQQRSSTFEAWGLPASDVAAAIGTEGFEAYPEPDDMHDAGRATLDGKALDIVTFVDGQQQDALLKRLADFYATRWPNGRGQDIAAGEGWAVLVEYPDDMDSDAASELQDTLLTQVRKEIGGRQVTLDGGILDATGRWEGAVLGDVSNYEVIVALGIDPESGVEGEVQYSELGCSGTWTLESGTADSLTFTEGIDVGVERCQAASEVLVEQESASELRLTFVGTDITAHLRRSAQ